MYIDCCCFAGNKKKMTIKFILLLLLLIKIGYYGFPETAMQSNQTTKSTNQSINQPQMTTEKIKNHHLNKLGNIFEEEKFEEKKTVIQIDSK